MSTKSMPSKFNCYAAALPDEPVFTILGRDPAAPATIKFWIEERIRQGKYETHDDVARIGEAKTESTAFVRWREENLNPFGDGPTWKLPRQIETDEPPIRVEPTDEEHDTPLVEALEAIVAIAKQPEVKYDEWLKICRIATNLLSQARQGVIAYYPTTQEYTAGLFRFDGDTYTYERLAEIVKAHVGPLQPGLHNAQDLLDIEAHSEVRRKIGCGVRQVAEDIYEFVKGKTSDNGTTGKWLLEQVDLLYGHAAELDSEHASTVAGIPSKLREDFWDAQIDRLKPGEKIIVDSAPEDLAHAPEVPQHRFSQFNKGKHYAYARGLEINPSHLPTALDAMQKDGWELVSLFGQTASEHVGFVFKRVTPAAYFIPGHDEWGVDPDMLREVMESAPEFMPVKLDLKYDTTDAQNKIAKVREAIDRFKDTSTLPKVEVHVAGLGQAEAIDILRQVECRLGWLRTDAEKLRVVGLIAHDPQAAFDFTQEQALIARRSTLTNGDCGDMEFGRQQEP